MLSPRTKGFVELIHQVCLGGGLRVVRSINDSIAIQTLSLVSLLSLLLHGDRLLQSQHLQWVEEDVNEWKFETTQSLQRKYMQTLWQLSKSLYDNPEQTNTYEELREHLDAHCERVYNGTCEWQFSPPFNQKARADPAPSPRESAAIVYLCCADAHELQDMLWSLQVCPRLPLS